MAPDQHARDARLRAAGTQLERGPLADQFAPQIVVPGTEQSAHRHVDKVRIAVPGFAVGKGELGALDDDMDKLGTEWIEIVDKDNRTFRIAVSRSGHLPLRMTVDTRDANTRMRSSQVFYFSNYHPLQGIMTPFQTTHERNGIKLQQVFYDKCEYNTGMSPDLFTEQSLQERWEKIAPKKKKNDKDDSESKSKN